MPARHGPAQGEHACKVRNALVVNKIVGTILSMECSDLNRRSDCAAKLIH